MRLRAAFPRLALLAALCLSACSTHPPRAPAPAEAANEILFSALALVGTPYRYGGSSPASGFDCSGLIQYVYRESAALSLPRTVAQMNTLDVPDVDEDELQAGDLRHTRDTVLGLIAEDTGQPVERVFEDSLHDRWFTAEEALAYGFIDSVITRFDEIAPRAHRQFGLTGETR